MYVSAPYQEAEARLAQLELERDQVNSLARNAMIANKQQEEKDTSILMYSYFMMRRDGLNSS